LIPHALVPRSPAQPAPGTKGAHGGNRAAHVAPPEAGIDKPGFVDNSPIKAGGELVRDAPLPPAARVFVSGRYPSPKRW
jgi:hypothetical protein